MLGFQRLAVKPFLGHALPDHDTATGSPLLVFAHHLLQQIFGLLLLLSDNLQLLTGFIILGQQISGSIGQGDLRLWRTAGEPRSEKFGCRIGTVHWRGCAVLHMDPKGRFQLNEHRDQFLVTLHKPPFEGIAADQHGDIGPCVPGHGHIVLHLAHIFVRDGVLPLPSPVCGGGLGFKYACPNVRDFTDAIQIRQHKRVFFTLEELLDLADLNPCALGELSPDDALQLRTPVGSLPGLLGRKLASLIQPQFHWRLVTVDAADYRSIGVANARLAVFQPIRIGHIFDRYQDLCGHITPPPAPFCTPCRSWDCPLWYAGTGFLRSFSSCGWGRRGWRSR